MNANTFLTNISKSLHSLEEQNNELSRTTNNNEFKIEEIRKNIADLATLLQQQSNFVDQHIKLIEEDIEGLKLNQNNILNKINEVLLKVENHSVKQNEFSTKSRK